jgi:hypothetical protein
MEEKQHPADKKEGGIGRSNFVTDGPAKNNEREEKISNRRSNIIDKDEGNMHHGTLGGNFNDEETADKKSEDK